MSSPVQQQASNLARGAGPVEHFAAVTSTTAEQMLEIPPAAAAARRDLAGELVSHEEIDLTAEPDSISYISEDARITQVRALSTVFWRILQKASNGSSIIHVETLELIPRILEGALQIAALYSVRERLHRLESEYAGASGHIGELREANQRLDRKWKKLERELIDAHCANQLLRIDKRRLEGELKFAIGDPTGDATESDTGRGRGKRRRGENDISEETLRNMDGSDVEAGDAGKSQREM
ncbi:uncharacterized protein BP5553_06888 [Venustampulla echinocandica]|uniref:Uncharacterized protein n=1 Tax=Venustampulla echinocandica TaxID=2656787 RepID=A0A370TL73_9HELO|nr:uncharacterized protein BP5553_06888 [Venustampulla echinocandica]RDL36276.1 hypothetical protein BP5553_06888 [Venustampulla echinocandica]